MEVFGVGFGWGCRKLWLGQQLTVRCTHVGGSREGGEARVQDALNIFRCGQEKGGRFQRAQGQQRF